MHERDTFLDQATKNPRNHAPTLVPQPHSFDWHWIVQTLWQEELHLFMTVSVQMYSEAHTETIGGSKWILNCTENNSDSFPRRCQSCRCKCERCTQKQDQKEHILRKASCQLVESLVWSSNCQCAYTTKLRDPYDSAMQITWLSGIRSQRFLIGFS